MNGQQNQLRVLLWVLGAVLVMGLLMAVVAWSNDGTTWMPGWGGMMAFGWLWMLVPLALMVAIMYGMMSMHGGHGGGNHPYSEDALALLDRRYAAGEVSRDQYLKMKEDLDRRP